MHPVQTEGIIDNSSPVFYASLSHFERIFSTNALNIVAYLAGLADSYASRTKTIYLMGCAGSGKSYLARKLVKYYRVLGANPFCLATDDYCIGTRSDRRQIIKETGDALLEKDFCLMERHIARIKTLKAGDSLVLPQEYDPETGLALDGDGRRTIQGSVGVLIIDGNFYVPSNEDLLVFLHVSDPVRYTLRAIRDTKKGQQRAKDLNDVITQFRLRQETQDKPHTLLHLKRAAILIESKPHIAAGEIKAAEYTVWKNKSAIFPSGKDAGCEEPSPIFLQS